MTVPVLSWGGCGVGRRATCRPHAERGPILLHFGEGGRFLFRCRLLLFFVFGLIFNHFCPFSTVGLYLSQQALRRIHEVAESLEKRGDDELQKLRLRARKIHHVSVHQRRHLHAALSLHVTLAEKLISHQLRSVSVQVPRPDGVAQIGALQYGANDHPPIIQVIPVPRLQLHPRLQLADVLEMGAHVGGKNGVDHCLPQLSKIGVGHVFKNILFRHARSGESEGKMVVFQHGLVVVQQSELILPRNDVGIVAAWMVNIVAHCRSEKRKLVPPRQLRLGGLLVHQHVRGMRHVHHVKHVVIGHLAVAVEYRLQERPKLVHRQAALLDQVELVVHIVDDRVVDVFAV
mmetsp:Transcript_43549/g.113400  ORF Transcript_43549/g.113400 Transcript_43549/m.113400 type:complete len:345 (+) Transcript_43549:369-1403(+)